MYLYYNGYWFDLNEAEVKLSRKRAYNAQRVLQGETHTWIVSGVKHAANQAALTTALNLMESYLQDGGDIGLYLDDATTLTSHWLRSSQTLGGTKITNLEYPNGSGAQYSTFRDWTFTLEALFPGPSSLLEYSEVLNFEGNGGPRHVYLETATGLPQKQIVNQRTVFKAQQNGIARRLGGYPTPAPYIWPQAVMHDGVRVAYSAQSGAAIEFGVTWSYPFQSADPLRGTPHLVF